MNIAYITAIISVLVLLIFVIISFIKAGDPRYQLVYVLVASLCIGIISTIILVNYDNKSAIIWPLLFLTHVISKISELMKML